MKKISVMFGFLSLLLLSGRVSAADFPGEQNLYNHVYEDLSQKPQEIALERVSKQLAISNSELQKILGGAADTALLGKLGFCGGTELTPTQIFACSTKVQDMFAEEELFASYEVPLEAEISAGDRWANGTLSDGSFDIVVDLNVIDVILFGASATVPTARTPGEIAPRRDRLISELIPPLSREPQPTPEN